jgi:starch synthase
MAKKRSTAPDPEPSSPKSAPRKASKPARRAKRTPAADPVPKAAAKTARTASTATKRPLKSRGKSEAAGTRTTTATRPPIQPAASEAAAPLRVTPPTGKTAKAAGARPRPQPGTLEIVIVASEMHPFATSGGLSEVISGLSATLGRLGHAVTVILPRYRRVQMPASSRSSGKAKRPDAGEERTTFQMGDRTQAVSFYPRAVSDGVSVVFVDAPELFDRDELYGDERGDYSDNGYRFAAFSRAALEYIRLRGIRPSVIHLHDWQTGLLPAYQKMLFTPDPVVGGVPVVFTIHNLAFQGLFPPDTLRDIGLPGEVLHIDAMEFHGRISYLKSGINFSERLTTVSPTYAREVLTPGMGCGFEGILSRRSDDLVGILNGIDTDRWNPSADPLVAAKYSAADLSGKRAAKQQLLERAGLDSSEQGLRRPLIGLVSRLTDQKGFDLIASAIEELMALDAAWVMLGSGEPRYEQLWSALGERLPGRVSARIGYDHCYEHLIEAGADAFLMPSRFEPCGLNQLNSLRYGTLPIVRATGGLNDTVTDASVSGGTGFTFAAYSAQALVEAVRRALQTYGDAETWARLQRNAMEKDYSWDAPALEYVKVYSANS